MNVKKTNVLNKIIYSTQNVLNFDHSNFNICFEFRYSIFEFISCHLVSHHNFPQSVLRYFGKGAFQYPEYAGFSRASQK